MKSKETLFALCVSAAFSTMGCDGCSGDPGTEQGSGSGNTTEVTSLTGTTTVADTTSALVTTSAAESSSSLERTRTSGSSSLPGTANPTGTTSASGPPKWPALVYTQTLEGTFDHPERSVQGKEGGDRAAADLVAGTFKSSARGISDAFEGGFAYSGVMRRIEFINRGSMPFHMPAGSIRVDVSGTYSRSGFEKSTANTGQTAATIVSTGGAFSSSSTINHHVWKKKGSPAEERSSTNHNDVGVVFEIDSSPSHLRGSMSFPGFTIAPGDMLHLSISQHARAQAWGGATSGADFYSGDSGISFSVTLPAGANVETNVPANASWLKRGI